jgi:small subunit ribosomal protein S20
MRDSSVIALTVDSAFSRFIDERGDAGCAAAGTARRACGRRARCLAGNVKSNYYGRSFFVTPETQHFMANTAQAKKRARQSEATRKRNASKKSALRTAVRNVRKAIAAGDKVAALKELQTQQSIIDRVADKKIVHKNLASRSKHRLAQAIKAMA